MTVKGMAVMKTRFTTFDYFISNYVDPTWHVFNVIDDKNHPEHSNLINDLESIENDIIEEFILDYDIDHLLDKSCDVEQQKRAYFYIHFLHQNSFLARIEMMLEPCTRPSPYDKPNLEEVEIDKHNLCILNQFNFDHFGIQKGDFVYKICPILDQSNSSYWMFKEIANLAKENKTIIKVRLDPFIEIPINDYHPVRYRMVLFGKPLKWKRILKLRNDEFGQWLDEKPSNRYGITDYIWSPRKDEVHFTCEELPKIGFEGTRASRYFHAIINKKSGKIKHCDGAIRFYSEDELIIRSKSHLRDPDVRKIGKRIKVFQFDSPTNAHIEISKETLCSLAMNFFIWNYDVLRYFG
jgi:hypothetical protein